MFMCRVEKMKKKLLFIYPSMMMGGSTTSLISVLNSIDYGMYEVDIIFFESGGELSGYIPTQVRILPVASLFANQDELKAARKKSLVSIYGTIKGRILSNIRKSNWICEQLRSKDKVRFCRAIEQEYDVAISYLEFWPMYYMVDKVIAKKKIAWIHTDYEKLNLYKKVENFYLANVDHIILVSEKCKIGFQKTYGEHAYKSQVIENFVSEEYILTRAEEKVEFRTDPKILNFVTTCRIDFASKALDRAVRVVKRLKEEGRTSQFHWYIIGDGNDYKRLYEQVIENKLEDCITLLGEQKNPFPYEKKCEVFFLPSYFEGKPMAVTEAQVLGLVPIVTNYSSAKEQVFHMKNGIILDNNEIGIYKGLAKILENPSIIGELKTCSKTESSIGEYQLKDFMNYIYNSCEIL